MGKKDKYDLSVLSGMHYQKSNALINSKGKANLLAHKLFAIGIQQAKEDKKTGILTATLRGTDLKKIFGTNSGSFYNKIKALVYPGKNNPSILDWRIILFDDVNQRVEAINVITDCTFVDGILEIRFNNKLNNQIREMKANYTIFLLSETIPLKSIYSYRLYEILKSEYDKQEYLTKKNGTWKPNAVHILDIDITDLKLRFGVIDASTSTEITNALMKSSPNYLEIEKLAEKLPDELKEEHVKFKRFDNFKRNTLDKPQAELAKKTSIYFEYEQLKKGKGGKTTGIRFYIHKKQNQSDVIEEPRLELLTEEKEEFLDNLSDTIQQKLKPKELRSIAEAANYDMEIIKEKYELSKAQNVDNFVGWMISAIKDDYSPATKAMKYADFKYLNTNNYDEFEEALFEN